MTSVGSILGGAFGLVRRHPGSVLVWGLIHLAAMALFLLAMRPFFQLYADLFNQQLAAGAGKPMGPPDLQPYLLRLQAAGGIAFLAQIGLFVLQIVLLTATQRAVLRPDQRGFFSLRFGGDELRLIGLAFVLAVGFYIAMMIAVLILAIVVGIAALAAGSPGPAILLFAIVFLALTAAAIYFMVRLSLAFPLTFIRGTFVVGEAWRVTRGRFWSLFGAYFVLALILYALGSVLFGFAVAPLFSEMMQSGGTPEAARLAFQHQFERVLNPDAGIAGLAIGFALLGGLNIALFGGAMATAARDLTTDAQGVTP